MTKLTIFYPDGSSWWIFDSPPRVKVRRGMVTVSHKSTIVRFSAARDWYLVQELEPVP